MATKFPKFSQDLAQDPTTRRIWYGIATAHDFESHDGMTEENLYQKIFASHFGHVAIIFLWTSGSLFHVAWQGNFEQWIKDPLKRPPDRSRDLGPAIRRSCSRSFHSRGRF
jgi:Photosystem I psaA/psaB protein.